MKSITLKIGTKPSRTRKNGAGSRIGNGHSGLNRSLKISANRTSAPTGNGVAGKLEIILDDGTIVGRSSDIGARQQELLLAGPVCPWLNATQLERPAFLLNF